MGGKTTVKHKWWMAIALPLWVYAGYWVIILLVSLLAGAGVSVGNVNPVLFETVGSAIVYVAMVAIVVGLPWLIFNFKTDRQEIGLSRLPSWLDIIITPAGLVIYVIISTILMIVSENILPSIDLYQAQELGFEGVNQRYEYILAFLSLVVIAPIAEEVLFRGFLFGKLKKYLPIWVAALVVSVTFGLIHGQWNLAIDTFALSLVLCLLRQNTGSLWSSILLHMTKNGIAYYILFIYPLIS